MATGIQLGFVVKPDRPFLPDINDFPSKIGGKPVWLNPEFPLDVESVRCGVCNKPMVLLLQIYAPEDIPAEAYHRCVYLFCCKNGKCHKESQEKSFKVYRSQLPKENKYYPEQLPLPAGQYPKDVKVAPLCRVSGYLGSKQCSKCKSENYSCKDCQIFHWNNAYHKRICCNANEKEAIVLMQLETKALESYLFPEYELVSEEEPPSNVFKENEKYDISKFTNATIDPNILKDFNVNEEDCEDTEVDVDKAFLKFEKRIAREPSQILRYARLHYNQEDSEPLWVCQDNKLTELKDCPHCGSKCTFEFQIMPQLLNYLNIDDKDPNSLDWGTVAVYTCNANCQPKDKHYMEGFVYHQYFSNDGLNKRFKAIDIKHKIESGELTKEEIEKIMKIKKEKEVAKADK
jgi:pre-rRNA-processing protein TSR4